MIGRIPRYVLIVPMAGHFFYGRETVVRAAPGERGSPSAPRPTTLDVAIQEIPKDTRALVLLDALLYKLVATETIPANNVLVSVVYGQSSFLAALGCPHNRVNDEGATPFFENMYADGYLGKAHLLRLRQQDKDSADPATLRTRQELLMGDPFLDTR